MSLSSSQSPLFHAGLVQPGSHSTAEKLYTHIGNSHTPYIHPITKSQVICSSCTPHDVSRKLSCKQAPLYTITYTWPLRLPSIPSRPSHRFATAKTPACIPNDTKPREVVYASIKAHHEAIPCHKPLSITYWHWFLATATRLTHVTQALYTRDSRVVQK